MAVMKKPVKLFMIILHQKINSINKVTKFIEKPKLSKAKEVIKKKGYWNSGMFYLRKDSIINNFKKYQNKTYKSCVEAIKKGKYKNIMHQQVLPLGLRGYNA